MRKIILGLVIAGLIGGVSITTLPPEPAYAASADMQGMNLEQARKLILDRVNAERKKFGHAPVTRSSQLDAYAQDWSATQAKNLKMSHRPNFTSGYPAGWRGAGENVAMGYRVKEVMDGWMGSTGHRENILNSGYNTIGIGIAEGSNGRLYYTQNLGSYAKVPSPVTGNPPPTTPPPAAKPSIAVGDVVAMDNTGKLWNYPKSGNGLGARKLIGSGWSSFKTIHTADWNGDGVMDIVANHTNGKLYVYNGLKQGGFNSSIIGSSGWQNMEIIAGKFKKSDKLPSIVAKDKAGALWNYPRSGNGLGARKQIGSGWGSLKIVKTDHNNDGGMDIVAKANNGDLWLYPTNGSGSFLAKQKVGNGWQSYKIHGQTGFKGGNTNGLVATDGAGKLWYYPQNTNGTFGARSNIGSSGWTPMRIANGM